MNFNRYGSLLISLGLHGLLFLAAGSFVIYRAIAPPKKSFVMQTQTGPKIKPRSLRHQLQVKKALSYGSTKAPQQKLAVANPTAAFSLPTPELTNPTLQKQNAEKSATDFAFTSFLGEGALGDAPRGESGWGEIEFLGQKVAARSVIILVDSSSSIVQKGLFDAVRAETDRMVTLFHPDTLFNVILFTDGAFSFSTNLTFATKKEKNRLAAWLSSEMRVNRGNNPQTSGSTPVVALDVALRQKPDVVFLLTDDPPYLKGEVDEHHEQRILNLIDRYRHDKKTQINTIAYRPQTQGKPKQQERAKRGIAFLKRVAQHGQGEFKEVQ